MRLLLLALALAGCAKEPRQGASSPPPPAAADAGPDPCVAACVKDSQMRATSIEQIERECREACAKTPPP